MNLTREEKDRIINVLKKAKPFVAEGFLVCAASSHTCSSVCDIYLTRGYVSGLIYPRIFVTGWLRLEHGITLNEDQATEYRIAWVDHMIKELKK